MYKRFFLKKKKITYVHRFWYMYKISKDNVFTNLIFKGGYIYKIYLIYFSKMCIYFL